MAARPVPLEAFGHLEVGHYYSESRAERHCPDCAKQYKEDADVPNDTFAFEQITQVQMLQREILRILAVHGEVWGDDLPPTKPGLSGRAFSGLVSSGIIFRASECRPSRKADAHRRKVWKYLSAGGG